MKKAIVVGITMLTLLAVNRAQAQSCQIINGSFEDDGYIADITVKEPNGWDVNIPATKFKGFVDNDWATDLNYSLTLHTQTWKTFNNGDMATVSQDVNLTDANEIIFDLKLESWNAVKVSAVMLIDGEVVWDSNNLSSGTYYDRVYTVEDIYRDGITHKLSFGIRVKVSEMLYIFYITKWDYIECTEFHECVEPLAGDFNHDCRVDYKDLKIMTDLWLAEIEASNKCNLFKGDDAGDDGGMVTFRDFAIFGLDWLESSSYEEPNEP